MCSTAEIEIGWPNRKRSFEKTSTNRISLLHYAVKHALHRSMGTNGLLKRSKNRSESCRQHQLGSEIQLCMSMMRQSCSGVHKAYASSCPNPHDQKSKCVLPKCKPIVRVELCQHKSGSSQQLTLIRPLRPYLVHSSKGLNQRTSSGLWNIHRTAAFFL